MTQVRYFAAARAAAGVEVDDVELTGTSAGGVGAGGVGAGEVPAGEDGAGGVGAGGATLADVLAVVRARHDARFGAVLAGCSLLVDGAPVGRRDPAAVPVVPTSVVEVLPPFAGG